MEVNNKTSCIEKLKWHSQRWKIETFHKVLKPILELMKSTLEKRNVVHADETVVQVLKEHGKTPQSQSYMWMMCSGGDGTPLSCS